MSDEITIPFGKHKGKELNEVPLLYLDWMRGIELQENDFKAALNSYLSDPSIEREIDRLIAEKEQKSNKGGGYCGFRRIA